MKISHPFVKFLLILWETSFCKIVQYWRMIYKNIQEVIKMLSIYQGNYHSPFNLWNKMNKSFGLPCRGYSHFTFQWMKIEKPFRYVIFWTWILCEYPVGDHLHGLWHLKTKCWLIWGNRLFWRTVYVLAIY